MFNKKIFSNLSFICVFAFCSLSIADLPIGQNCYSKDKKIVKHIMDYSERYLSCEPVATLASTFAVGKMKPKDENGCIIERFLGKKCTLPAGPYGAIEGWVEGTQPRTGSASIIKDDKITERMNKEFKCEASNSTVDGKLIVYSEKCILLQKSANVACPAGTNARELDKKTKLCVLSDISATPASTTAPKINR